MGDIRTFTGRLVDPMNMRVEDVDIVDIAHALSLTCRYGGHSRALYSVAEHSCQVMWNVECRGEEAIMTLRTALLHDAAEAYLGDMMAPVKHGGSMDAFIEAEDRLERVITKRFDLWWPHPPVIKEADKEQLAWEQKWVFDKDGGLSAREAERQFLKQWRLVRTWKDHNGLIVSAS